MLSSQIIFDVLTGLSYLIIPIALARLFFSVKMELRTSVSSRDALLLNAHISVMLVSSFVLFCGLSHLFRAATGLMAGNELPPIVHDVTLLLQFGMTAISFATAAFFACQWRRCAELLCCTEVYPKGAVDKLVRDLETTHGNEQASTKSVQRFDMASRELGDATNALVKMREQETITAQTRVRDGDLFRLLEELLSRTASSVNTIIAFVSDHNNMMSSTRSNINTSLANVRLLRMEINQVRGAAHRLAGGLPRMVGTREAGTWETGLAIIFNFSDLAFGMVEHLGSDACKQLACLNWAWNDLTENTLCDAFMSGPQALRRSLRLAGVSTRLLLPPMPRCVERRNRMYLVTNEARSVATLKEARRRFEATNGSETKCCLRP